MRAEIGVENAVIGAVLLEAECLDEVLDVVSLDDFNEPMARRCFAAMLRLRESGRLLDPMTVMAELGNSSEMGMFLADVMTMTATATNAVEHARLVSQSFLLLLFKSFFGFPLLKRTGKVFNSRRTPSRNFWRVKTTYCPNIRYKA